MHSDSIRRISWRVAHFWDCFKLAFLPLKCLNCGSLFQSQSFEIINSNHPSSASSLTGKILGTDLQRGNFQTISPATMFTQSMAEHLCPICAHQFRPTETPCCVHCGLMFVSREGRDHVCGECLQSQHFFGMARSVGVYDQVLMAVIHRFKYRHRVNLARPLSLLLLHTYCRFWHEHPMDLVVPVPLYRHRFRERGYNQAYLLLRPWKEANWQQALPKPLAISRNILMRRRQTAPQTGLGRQDRKRNVSKAFGLKNGDQVKGKKILLMDDVYTTGATVNECARVIRQAGAERVDVLTLARAI